MAVQICHQLLRSFLLPAKLLSSCARAEMGELPVDKQQQRALGQCRRAVPPSCAELCSREASGALSILLPLCPLVTDTLLSRLTLHRRPRHKAAEEPGPGQKEKYHRVCPLVTGWEVKLGGLVCFPVFKQAAPALLCTKKQKSFLEM